MEFSDDIAVYQEIDEAYVLEVKIQNSTEFASLDGYVLDQDITMTRTIPR